MESVGEFFRQVRETKGLTIDEVASKTRIHPDFLRALEDGNYSKLPDQVFAKGFVRAYARSLGLDEEEAMRRFVESAGLFYEKQVQLERLRVQQVEETRKQKTNRKVLIASVGVAILALVLLLGREQSSVLMKRQTPISPSTGPTVVLPESPTPVLPVPIPDPQTEKAPAGNLPRGAPASNADRSANDSASAPKPGPSAPAGPALREPMASEPVPTAPAAAVPAPPAAPSSGASPLSPPVGSPIQEPLVLALEATELSWVVVQMDDGSPHEALLRPGERITWTASDRFVVTLGNAGGVSVELNGEPKGPFGPSGTVARDIVLTR